MQPLLPHQQVGPGCTFLWLTPRRTGLTQWPLFGLQVLVTVALAVASYHLLEQPIRLRRWLTGWQPLAAAASLIFILTS